MIDKYAMGEKLFTTSSKARRREKKLQEPSLRERSKRFFAQTYENYATPQERVDMIHHELKEFEGFVAEISRFDELLRTLLGVQNKGKFCRMLMAIFEPLFLEAENRPRDFELKMREQFWRVNDWEKVNDMIGFAINGGDMELHVAPCRTESNSWKMQMVRDALKKISHIVEKDESIKKVVGESWIVAANPGLIKLLGFIIVEPTEKKRKKSISEIFFGRSGVGRMEANREEFLGKWL